MALKSKPCWVPINKRSKPSVHALGGKGANLVRMAKAGFRVPPGIILTTHLLSSKSGQNLSELERIINKAVSSFSPWTQWAVRSSGVAEDGDQSSFAGQHETFLNVPCHELAQRVLDCLDSAHSPHAASYCEKMNNLASEGMAVVIQAMVNARCAGVLFTRHPVRPDVNRIVVEGIPGLGDDLVSGRRDPDRMELSRAGKSLECISLIQNYQCLEAVGAELFAETACRMERVLGSPQDVEWAFDGQTLWLLQTRPITTLKRPSKVWTRSWGDEFWAEATTDLQYTLMSRWIKEDYIRDLGRISGWTFLAQVEPFKRINSHVYFNPEYMRGLLTLVPPAFRMERFLNWMPPYWRAEVSTLKYKPFAFLMSLLRSSLRDQNSGILTHYKKLPKYMKGVRNRLAEGLAQDLAQLSDNDLWQRLLQNDKMGKAHFRFVRWGLGSYLVPTRMLCAWISERWTSHTKKSDPEGHFFEMLMTSPEGNLTTQVNGEIRELGRFASQIQGLKKRLASRPDAPDLAEIASMAGSEAFLREFNLFIKRHGHRGTSREMHLPRWMDDPGLVLNSVLVFVTSSQESRAEIQHQDFKESWLDETSRQPGGWWKRAVSAKILTLAREYTRYRENQRYVLDYILADMRHVIMEMGRRLVDKGLLQKREDVFFLTYEELVGLLHGSQDQPQNLESRRTRFQNDSLLLPPEWIMDGEPFPKDRDIQEGAHMGTPASPGIGSGLARVVLRVEDLRHVRQGEILVAPNTDSGWTPVFGLISGLIVQTGGMLSHAAIVAREYGIPAITGVPNACQAIRTNDYLEINGHNGAIIMDTSTRENQTRAI